MAKVAVMLMALCLFGCDDDSGPATFTKENAPQSETLNTVKHDGHLWVLARISNSGVRYGYAAVAFQHHPDCECFKVKR